MPARVSAVNLPDVEDFLESQPAVTRKAARLAVNDTARKTRTMSRREMRKQVNFPAGYLTDEKRFGIRKFATESDLTATISARFRPTSLARFAQGATAPGSAARRGGVKVKVNPGGGAKFLRKAFFVRLRRGKDTSDGFNLGLAIRLKPGETIRGRRKGGSGVMLDKNVALLYGPSIDQIFRDISTTESPAIARQLEQEFLRQWVRLSGTTK